MTCLLTGSTLAHPSRMGGSDPCNDPLSFCLAYAVLRMGILYSNERRARRLPACRTDIAGVTIPQLDVTSRVDNGQVGVFTAYASHYG
jgi:hypothetical protein